VIRDLVKDAVEITKVFGEGELTPRAFMDSVVTHDSFRITISTRVREAARKLHIPLVSRFLRLAQMTVYGIEIGKDVTLGHGVFFAHSLGVVIGGDARIGDRVRFMGNNTVGTAKENGYPTIEEDVMVGCGARILGPITVGARSVIGANSVVVQDVPPDSVVMGIPGKVVSRVSIAPRDVSVIG
jgi:serine O-acetyltransferase